MSAMGGRILGGDAFFYYLAASSKASHSLGIAARGFGIAQADEAGLERLLRDLGCLLRG